MQHISVIGTIYNVDTTDPENPVSTPMDGWHVNTTEPVPEWVDYLVEPSHPREMFLNLPTVCYKFDSQEAYQAAHVAVFGPTDDELNTD
jgi:hypothetical protein